MKQTEDFLPSGISSCYGLETHSLTVKMEVITTIME